LLLPVRPYYLPLETWVAADRDLYFSLNCFSFIPLITRFRVLLFLLWRNDRGPVGTQERPFLANFRIFVNILFRIPRETLIFIWTF